MLSALNHSTRDVDVSRRRRLRFLFLSMNEMNLWLNGYGGSLALDLCMCICLKQDILRVPTFYNLLFVRMVNQRMLNRTHIRGLPSMTSALEGG